MTKKNRTATSRRSTGAFPGWRPFRAAPRASDSPSIVSPNWRAKLFVNNITNKLYYDALYQSAAPFVFVAPGRSATMVLSARF